MIYYETPVKCLNCSLHFKLYSNHDDKSPEFVFCPECGKQGNKLLWAAKAWEGFIFEEVPGDAIGRAVEMDVSERSI
jgi:hypothetical protein